MSKVFFYVMFALSLALTAFLGWSLVETHLLTGQIVLIGAAVLALIPMLLFLLQKPDAGFRFLLFRLGLRHQHGEVLLADPAHHPVFIQFCDHLHQ